MGLVAVCTDPAAASLLAEHGAAVVLCGTDEVALAHLASTLRITNPSARVALLIGDPAQAEVGSAAAAMAEELFSAGAGATAVTVDNVAEACHAIATSGSVDSHPPN